MSDYDIYVEKFEEYLSQRNKKDDFDVADGNGKAEIANEYVREEIPFDKKPAVIRALNEKFAGQGPFLYNSDKICNPDKIYDSIEMEIYLLKRLQSGEDIISRNKRDDIAEEFGYSSRTLAKKIQKLNLDHDLLGSRIEIENLRHGNNTYDHTIHPVFLALNLTEVYFLTVILPKLAKRYEKNIKNTALDLAGDVYRQLSGYGKEKIDHFISEADKDNLLNRRKGYRKEDEMGFLHYLKHYPKIKCVLELKGQGVVYGTIWPANGDKFKIINDKTGESRLFDSKDIVKCLPC